MKEKLTKILESIAYIFALGFGFYILYIGFRLLWVFSQSILK